MADNGDSGLSPIVTTALLAGLLQEGLDDLHDRLDTQPKPEVLNHQVLADLLEARLRPDIQLLHERLVALNADVALLKVRMRARRWR